MILADTSVWIDHLRRADPILAAGLLAMRVLSHPFIIGEVALGSLANRNAVLRAMLRLPQAVVARDNEVLRLIDTEALYGLGIGYIDAHLLAACRLSPGARLWTRDKRLGQAALRLNIAAADRLQ